jgi:transposase
MANGWRIAVGVDTGKRWHRAAAYDVAAGGWLGEVSVPVSRAGFDRFVAFLDGLPAERRAVVVGLEATGHYHLTLAEHLAAAGFAVAVLDPYRASQFRRSEGHKAKTDRLDARALARFLACQPAVGWGAPERRPRNRRPAAGAGASRGVTGRWAG